MRYQTALRLTSFLHPRNYRMPITLSIALILFITHCAASAIQCTRATTIPEISICSNPVLKAYDEYLDDAYTRLRTSTVPAEFARIRKSQIQWILDRDLQCAGNVACMVSETQTRTAVLNGLAQQFVERKRYGHANPPEPRSAPLPMPNAPLSAQEVYKRATMSVVVVLAYDGLNRALSQGSGVVLARDTVATNCHVISGAKDASIMFRGSRYAVTNFDGDQKADFCVLRTQGLPAIPTPLAALSSLTPGQKVYSIGSPRGLELTIADGLISGLRNQLGIPMPMIQTSAAISPGSSGGGLFGEYGRIVGITTSQLRESQNLNFALPIELFLRFLK